MNCSMLMLTYPQATMLLVCSLKAATGETISNITTDWFLISLTTAMASVLQMRQSVSILGIECHQGSIQH